MDKDEIARVRAVPLKAVLQRLGAKRDPKDPVHNWRLGASRITVTDERFYDHNRASALHRMREGRAGGGGAIDLVQYLKDIGFREAVRELGGLAGSRESLISVTVKTAPIQKSTDARPQPSPAPNRAARAHWYLTTVRRIPNFIVDQEMRGEAALTPKSIFARALWRLQDESL